MQTKISKINQPTFKAIRIADTQNCVQNKFTKIQLYEVLPKKDKHFLKTLVDKVDIKNFIADLTKENYSRWHEMLEFAVDNSLKPNRKTYIAVKDNKPCGIMAFQPNKKTFHLDCICTWPTEFGQKVQLAGTTLFNQLFKNFTEVKANKIKLEAITDGPFDVVRKYEKLGFFPVATEGKKIIMETNVSQVESKLKDLEKIIEYKSVKNSQNENLLDILSI